GAGARGQAELADLPPSVPGDLPGECIESDTGLVNWAVRRPCVAARQATGARVSQPGWASRLAGACLLAGEGEAGLAVVAEALRQSAETGDCGADSALWRLQGELLLGQGPADEAGAEACLQKSVATARHQSAKLLELVAATALARFWQQGGKRS